MRIRFTAALLGLLTLSASALCAEQAESAGGERSLAVVNPVVASPLRPSLSLAGTWEFAMDPKQVGDEQEWQKPGAEWPGAEPIQVPGCWEAQGVGGPGPSASFTPERRTRPLRGSFVGTGWYRKVVRIGAEWVGKQVWIEFGGVHAQGWFWVNGTYLGHDASYCGAYKYNITDLVKPGADAVIVCKVRNDVASYKGLYGWLHRFGGLYRSVEIEATDNAYIDNAYVEGLLDEKKARVHIVVRSVGTDGSVPDALEIAVKTLDGKSAGSDSIPLKASDRGAGDYRTDIDLEPFRPWSPETPNLYIAEIVLKAGDKEIDGWFERFGVRKWERRGGNFYLNNRKFFVRGFGDDWTYPLTICSPADRDAHRRHFQLARDFGFVYVRQHTHCEIPEYFEAADEMGIMIQPELPYYGAIPSAAVEGAFRPMEDLRELVDHYRRYVSLSTYCTGNEGHLGSPIDKEIYALAKRLDPTRLFLHQDGGGNTPENSDFLTGPPNVWEPGAMGDEMPFFAHEYLNLAVSPDPRLTPKYTGAQLPPNPLDAYEKRLAEAHLSRAWGDACLDAGLQIQGYYQKRGLESARFDPVCDGYIYWTMMDVNYDSDQGLLDQFWDVKKSTPEFFRQFNSPTALLAKLEPAEPIYSDGDRVAVAWWISHFGAEALQDRTLKWRVVSDTDELAFGSVCHIDAETGGVGPATRAGDSSFRVPPLARPLNVRLIAEIEGTDIRNSWNLWLFPKIAPKPGKGAGICADGSLHAQLAERYPGLARLDAPEASACDTLLSGQLDGAALRALGEGKNVIVLSLRGPKPGVALGWWGQSAQTGAALATGAMPGAAAFGDFPHQGYLNGLLMRLVGSTVKRADYPTVEPLMLNGGAMGYLMHAFQARAGKGKLLASGLDLLSDTPEAQYLLDCFIRYARSDAFEPGGVLDIAEAQARWEEAEKLMRDLNGWASTVEQYGREPYHSFLGDLTMCTARLSDKQIKVVWKTQPVPEDVDRTKDYRFRWVAALGYLSQPEGAFSLQLGGCPLLDFDVTHETKTWRSADGKAALTFTVVEHNAEDAFGVMELTVPVALLEPGRNATLSVVPHRNPESRRWFGIYEYP